MWVSKDAGKVLVDTFDAECSPALLVCAKNYQSDTVWTPAGRRVPQSILELVGEDVTDRPGECLRSSKDVGGCGFGWLAVQGVSSLCLRAGPATSQRYAWRVRTSR